MQSIAKLGSIEVLDIWGKPVFFRDLWQDKTTVLVLVRHFGCLFCYEQGAGLLQVLPDIAAASGQLLLLGNGNPAHAGEFMRASGLDGVVYTDPARLIYRGLGFNTGMLRTYNLESTRNARRAVAAGHRQRGVKGDRWQLGGALVVEPDGAVAYRYAAEVAGDHAPLSDILRALRSSVARRR
jgi:hypothetical protein